MAPATDKQSALATSSALIVAHGVPSDPDPHEKALQALARRVNALLSGWKVEAATLSAKGQFEKRVSELGSPVIYPFFMAQGWFTANVLQKKADGNGLEMMHPFGVENGLVHLASQVVGKSIASMGWQKEEAGLLIAAHGSARSSVSADSAYAFGRQLADMLSLKHWRCGFIEQEPRLDNAASGMRKSVCLPFFAMSGEHVIDDIPALLQAAGFDGPVLDPFIDWRGSAEVIARSLSSRAAFPVRERQLA